MADWPIDYYTNCFGMDKGISCGFSNIHFILRKDSLSILSYDVASVI